MYKRISLVLIGSLLTIVSMSGHSYEEAIISYNVDPEQCNVALSSSKELKNIVIEYTDGQLLKLNKLSSNNYTIDRKWLEGAVEVYVKSKKRSLYNANRYGVKAKHYRRIAKHYRGTANQRSFKKVLRSNIGSSLGHRLEQEFKDLLKECLAEDQPVDKETPVFMGGFDNEEADENQWAALQYNDKLDKSRQFSVVTSPVRHGKYAAKMVVNDGDVSFGGERADLVRPFLHDENEGDEYWYAWSTFFPKDWQAPVDWFVFADWHSRYDGVCQLLQFEVTTENKLLASVLTGDVTDYNCFNGSGSATYEAEALASLATDTWNDFIVHVKWTAKAEGIIEIFHKTDAKGDRFEKVLDRRGIPTLQYKSNMNNPELPSDISDPKSPYFKLAHYRSSANTHTSTLYHDGFRQGRTRKSIESGDLYRLDDEGGYE